VDLVDVGLLGREGNMFADLLAHFAQERVVDELVDDSMLVTSAMLVQNSTDECADIRLRFGVVLGVAGEPLALEQALIEVFVRLIVGDGSLLRLAISRRLVLALWHNGCKAIACVVKSRSRRAELAVNFGSRKLLGCRHTTMARPLSIRKSLMGVDDALGLESRVSRLYPVTSHE
jgi:hypothetical protein